MFFFAKIFILSTPAGKNLLKGDAWRLPKSSRVGLEIPHEAWQPQLAPEHGLRPKLDLVWTLFLFCAFFSIKGYQKIQNIVSFANNSVAQK